MTIIVEEFPKDLVEFGIGLLARMPVLDYEGQYIKAFQDLVLIVS